MGTSTTVAGITGCSTDWAVRLIRREKKEREGGRMGSGNAGFTTFRPRQTPRATNKSEGLTQSHLQSEENTPDERKKCMRVEAADSPPGAEWLLWPAKLPEDDCESLQCIPGGA